MTSATDSRPPLIKGLRQLESCPLCEATKSRLLYDFDLIRVHKCLGCALFYLNPCLDAGSMAAVYEDDAHLLELNDFYKGYHEYGDIEGNSQTLREIHRCLESMERYLPPDSGKTLLEIGAGNCLFLAAAQKRGWEVAGIESSSENVALAAKKYSISLRHGLFEQSEWKKESFYAVVMMDVLEHRYDPKEFLSRVVPLIKPGGMLLITVPNHDSMLRYVSQGLYWLSGSLLSTGLRKVYLLEHTAYYNYQTMHALLSKQGIEIVQTFQSSTDLNKYDLSKTQKLLAKIILTLGRWAKLENRLIVLGLKK